MDRHGVRLVLSARMAGWIACRAGALAFVVLGLMGTPGARAEHRVALVVGNAAYVHAPPLKNPLHDAAKVGETLRNLDFSVTVVDDADKIAMEQALRRFSVDLEGADVALFYYSGHAVQVDDRNYLVPVSAAIDGPRNLTLDTLALQDVSSAMRQAGAKVQLLFLDACRDNPFGSSLSAATGVSAVRGLAPVRMPGGSLIVFSTSPGEGALDGTGLLSPFTDAFTRFALLPHLEIRQVLTRVRSDVEAATGQRQTPWDSSSLLGDFFLVPHRLPPVFEPLSHVHVESDRAPHPLRLTAPVQPEGGALILTLTTAPKAGHLLLNGNDVIAGDRLTTGDYGQLSYQANADDGAGDRFGVTVDDAWGNTGTAVVELARSDVPAVAPVAAVKRPLASVEANATSLLGIGPNLIFRDPPQVADASPQDRVRLASTLPLGQIVVGDRVVEAGRSVEVSDIGKLAFNPPAGSQGRHLDAVFDGDAGAKITIGIDVSMTDCDRLAGDRLDQQGVSEGVLTGLIDTTAALPACETAARAKPKIGRFAYQLGRVYAAQGHDAEAMAQFQKAADLGHVRATWALGNHLSSIPPVDLARSKSLLESAAAAGDIYAVHSLAKLYAEARGVPQDLAKAKGLYETAARMGHTFSMNALGSMYADGEGVPVDQAMARRYWTESAARGDIYGINNLGYAYLDGIDVPPDPAKALTYFKQAAALGHPDAPNSIGRLYIMGKGVSVDYGEARHWETLGADRGDAWAAYNLAELYRLGRGGPANAVEAGYYYARAAASLNHLDAAELGRKQIAGLDRRTKVAVLGRLVGDIGPTSPDQGEPAVMAGARRAVGTKGIKPADTSLDAMLVAAAQAVWLERNKRADLF